MHIILIKRQLTSFESVSSSCDSSTLFNSFSSVSVISEYVSPKVPNKISVMSTRFIFYCCGSSRCKNRSTNAWRKENINPLPTHSHIWGTDMHSRQFFNFPRSMFLSIRISLSVAEKCRLTYFGI